MITLLLLCAATASPNTTAMYPMFPVSLQTLLRDAEVIALVREVDSESASESGGWISEVKVEFGEVLKGPPGLAEQVWVAAVQYPCDGPPKFRRDRETLIFLERLDDGVREFYAHAAWEPVGNVYGTKDFEPELMEVYLERVREHLVLSAEPDAPTRRAMRAEWVFQVLLHPAIRGEGLLALSEGGLHDRHEPGESCPGLRLLTDAQREELLFALGVERDVDANWLYLVRHLEEGGRSFASEALLLSTLRAAITGEREVSAIRSTADLLKRRVDDEQLEAHAKALRRRVKGEAPAQSELRKRRAGLRFLGRYDEVRAGG